MPRAIGVIAADHRREQMRGRPVVDTVILDYAQRSAPKMIVTSIKGGTIEIDLRGSVRLCTDDLLVLDDGNLVEVVASPESLIEARTVDVSTLARLAWHLGDRHIQAQFLPNRVRAQRDASTEALLVSLGAKVTIIEAPFEPEGGAYTTSQGHGHHHGYDHSDDHGHAHSHAHGHHHDH